MFNDIHNRGKLPWAGPESPHSPGTTTQNRLHPSHSYHRVLLGLCSQTGSSLFSFMKSAPAFRFLSECKTLGPRTLQCCPHVGLAFLPGHTTASAGGRGSSGRPHSPTVQSRGVATGSRRAQPGLGPASPLPGVCTASHLLWGVDSNVHTHMLCGTAHPSIYRDPQPCPACLLQHIDAKTQSQRKVKRHIRKTHTAKEPSLTALNTGPT